MIDWKNEFRNKCVGKVDGESFAFVPLTEEFISNLLQQEKVLSFKEGRASMVEKVIEKVSGMAIYGKQEQNKIIEDIINKIQDNE